MVPYLDHSLTLVALFKMMLLIPLAENSCPHNSPVMAFTFQKVPVRFPVQPLRSAAGAVGVILKAAWGGRPVSAGFTANPPQAGLSMFPA